MLRTAALALASFVPAGAQAMEGAAHRDPLGALALALALILFVAKIGADLALRLGQPAVLGELAGGVLAGNFLFPRFPALEFIKAVPAIDMLSGLGVLLLLFEVGLESTVSQMLSVGASALLVATLGVAFPFGLGWAVGAWLLPEQSPYVHVFLGATLTATSVGITARVFMDLGRSQSRESRIVLGAAVIDDILGLVVLAVVTGVIAAADRGGSLSLAQLTVPMAKAVGFLIGALAAGSLASRKIFSLASRLKTRGVLLATALGFCFFLSWLSSAIGLAPIVGAFAAGLVLEEAHCAELAARDGKGLGVLVEPLSSFLVPVFFVVMGMKTDLRTFLEPGVIGLAAALTLAAILGKQACALGVLERGTDRVTVGLGMIPRGEVGLIFANIGLSLSVQGARIIRAETFSALVVMVILTTMVTPPALKWSLNRRPKNSPDRGTYPK